MRYKILLVDDEPNVLLGMSIYIRKNCKFQTEIDTAGSGEEAFALLSGASYHLVISDVKMPGMGGIEFMKRVSARFPDLLMILLTGHESFDALYTAIRYPNVKYILKIEDGEKIIAMIDESLESIRLLTASGDAGVLSLLGGIEQYVSDHILEGLSVNVIADKFHFNPSYLSRLYKNHRGDQLSNFIKRVQIQRAKELLDKPGSKINEVSDILGFSSPSYFISTFKKSVGITPKQYKRTANP
ncbi:MAG: response regulator [Clostridiales bacterium]|jgi:YesN/AraC family two-component response regulator|nr:response regulator [Clostridiales bacterium]